MASQLNTSVPTRLPGVKNGTAEKLLVAASEEQKRRWIPPLASGEYLGAWALTEMLLFIGVLALGLVYVWVKRDLEWVKQLPAEQRRSKMPATSRPVAGPVCSAQAIKRDGVHSACARWARTSMVSTSRR